jgi:hypothetical protein
MMRNTLESFLQEFVEFPDMPPKTTIDVHND